MKTIAQLVKNFPELALEHAIASNKDFSNHIVKYIFKDGSAIEMFLRSH